MPAQIGSVSSTPDTSVISLPDSEEDTNMKSSKFFWDFVSFVVDGIHYQVPRFLFEGSCILYDEPPTYSGAIPIVDVTSQEFDCLLSIMYPTMRASSATFAHPLADWTSVLKLSTQFQLYDIREKAIAEMTPLLKKNLADFFVLAITYGVPDWLKSSCIDLVKQDDFLDVQQKTIGHTMTILVYGLREKRLRGQIYDRYPSSPPGSIAHAVDAALSAELSCAQIFAEQYGTNPPKPSDTGTTDITPVTDLDSAIGKKKGKKGKK